MDIPFKKRGKPTFGIPYLQSYEENEMKRFVLHLLVLSLSYSVSSLKRVCLDLLEHDCLTKENVIDILQLARSCDAPQLPFICVRMVVKDLKSVSSTEGWKVVRRANPSLEQELVESVVEADLRKQERLTKIEERKVYLQLYEAMEALLHICRDGWRTIGPCERMLKGSQVACNFPACKGLESLVLHFSKCKSRVPGGCIHCKRMWQLLELHSRMRDEPDSCKAPLAEYCARERHTRSTVFGLMLASGGVIWWRKMLIRRLIRCAAVYSSSWCGASWSTVTRFVTVVG